MRVNAYRLRLSVVRIVPAIALVVAVACGTQTTAPVSSGQPSATSLAATAGADLVYALDRGASGGVLVIDAKSGTVLRSLPSGAFSADWSTLFRAEAAIRSDGDRTSLQMIDVATGNILRQTMLDGVLDLPLGPGVATLPGGLSPSAKWVVLAARNPDARGERGFVVVDSGLTTQIKFSLPSAMPYSGFEFDAIADDGRTLYLLETVAVWQGGGYRVRAFDLASRTLLAAPIVDKRDQDETMRGQRVAGVTSVSGDRLFSLYTREADVPFVHVLDLNSRTAICLFLPEAAMSNDYEANLLWSLAPAPDGRTLYAVNAGLGKVSVVDMQDLAITRSASFTIARSQDDGGGVLGAVARFFFPVAYAKRALIGGATVSADGKTLFAIGMSGIVAIDTSTLAVRSRYASESAFGGMALAPDGAHLYASGYEVGYVAVVDLATGSLGAVNLSSPTACGPCAASAVLHVETAR